jgi:hypothetical protein
MKDAETGSGVLGSAPKYRETSKILLDGWPFTAISEGYFQGLTAETQLQL